MDRVSMFGFVVGFLTLVAVKYRRDLRSGFPVLTVLVGGCAVYGFLQGAWPLGFVLLAIASSEFASWWRGSHSAMNQAPTHVRTRFVGLYQHDARRSRMFERR